jgi:serine/threonine protein phosphatase PrpC
MDERADQSRITFWAATDVGRVRDHNEDNFLVDRKFNLFIVADGMGGHAAGEVASALAVNTVRDVVARNEDIVQEYVEKEGSTRQDILNLFEHALQEACVTINDIAQKSPEKRGMGTTLSALMVIGRRGFIAHVGDSRIYLLRSGRVHQLTEDHSLINELIKRGKLKKEEAGSSPYKNAVTRAVGVYPSVEVDTLDFDVLPGDQFLLATDGLHGYLNDGELPMVMSGGEVRTVPDRLIGIANERGGRDNITAVVIRLGEEPGVEERLQKEVNLKIEALKNMPLFRYLVHSEVLRVLNHTEIRAHDTGSSIVIEGEQGEELFIILEGECLVTKGGADMAHLGPGAHFGEMALVDSAPRSATVSALAPCRTIVMTRTEFFAIIRQEPKTANKLMWSFLQVLTSRLRQTSEELRGAREEAIYDLDNEPDTVLTKHIFEVGDDSPTEGD